jgi:hypothetical protein
MLTGGKLILKPPVAPNTQTSNFFSPNKNHRMLKLTLSKGSPNP